MHISPCLYRGVFSSFPTNVTEAQQHLQQSEETQKREMSEKSLERVEEITDSSGSLSSTRTFLADLTLPVPFTVYIQNQCMGGVMRVQ